LSAGISNQTMLAACFLSDLLMLFLLLMCDFGDTTNDQAGLGQNFSG
jgi:hypothetical protein